MLAYAYDVDAANNLRLLVYDCNDPFNDDSAISLNLTGDFLHAIPMSSPAVSAHMNGGLQLRRILPHGMSAPRSQRHRRQRLTSVFRLA